MDQHKKPPGATLGGEPEAPWGYRKDGTPRSKPGVRKNAASSSSKRSSSATRKASSSSRKSAPKPEALYLEKWQAARITELIAGQVEKRYPEVGTLNLPTAAQQERLAHVIFRISDVPPFSLVQPLFRRVVSMSGIAGAGQKKGSSLIGDLGQYLYSWYDRNPDQLRAIYAGEVINGRVPPIPLLPDPRRIIAEQMPTISEYMPYPDMPKSFAEVSANMDQAMKEAQAG